MISGYQVNPMYAYYVNNHVCKSKSIFAKYCRLDVEAYRKLAPQFSGVVQQLIITYFSCNNDYFKFYKQHKNSSNPIFVLPCFSLCSRYNSN